MKWQFAFLLVLSLLFLVSCGPNQEQLQNFATCLTDQGAVMYGASWCVHCKEQKEMFGDAFVKVNYVECTIEEQRCSEENISGLPTWKFKDGSILEGALPFSELESKTGCKLR
ncbi:MAG: thioredoxin family protein [Candidatus Woesearchaeota archaeon]|jgi:hypothetical protein